MKHLISLIVFLASVISFNSAAADSSVEIIKKLGTGLEDCKTKFQELLVLPGFSGGMAIIDPSKVDMAISKLISSKITNSDYEKLFTEAAKENPKMTNSMVFGFIGKTCSSESYRTAMALINTAAAPQVPRNAVDKIKKGIAEYIMTDTLPILHLVSIDLFILEKGAAQNLWQTSAEKSEIQTLQAKLRKLQSEISDAQATSNGSSNQIMTTLIQEFKGAAEISADTKKLMLRISR